MQSYFDMSDYAGKNIFFQFRFGTDDNTAVPNGGWVVDQVDIMDMLNYDSEACVRSNAGDEACARAPERGVIMDVNTLVSTEEPATDNNILGLRVQPNPATDMVALSFGASAEGPVQVQIIGADGRVAVQHRLSNVSAGQVFPLDIQHLPAGLYIIQVESNKGSSVAKVVKQ
ncbi:MAG: T9SS type A sorting domain-containing protein [Lewinellaceae bacterium]|nr:T9SS type A sorting domain-containing protein [Lewinellaceae bacterium]